MHNNSRTLASFSFGVIDFILKTFFSCSVLSFPLTCGWLIYKVGANSPHTVQIPPHTVRTSPSNTVGPELGPFGLEFRIRLVIAVMRGPPCRQFTPSSLLWFKVTASPFVGAEVRVLNFSLVAKGSPSLLVASHRSLSNQVRHCLRQAVVLNTSSDRGAAVIW